MSRTPAEIERARADYTWDQVAGDVARSTKLTQAEAVAYASPDIRATGVHPWDWASDAIELLRAGTPAAAADALRRVYERGQHDEDAALEAAGVDLE